MNRLVSIAVERWQFTLLMTGLLVALGLSAFQAIPRAEDPELKAPIYFVTAVLPGSTPADIEQQVTKPVEDALAGLDDVREIRSTTGDGIASIRAEFVWGTDPERKYDEIVREVNALRGEMPSGVTRLEVVRARPTDVSLVQLALVSDVLPMRSLDKLARDLRDRLARIPGMRKAEVYGAPQSELRVALDTDKLASLGIAPGTVVQALQAGGVETPIGTVDAGARRFNVRYAGAYPDAAGVRDILVTSHDGMPVHVGDVASVEWASREASHIVRFDGKRALSIAAFQADGQDVGALSRQVEAELDTFTKRLPGSVKLERGFDQAKNVEHRMDGLTRDFLLAFAIVSATLLPLGWRATGVVMIAIPLSLLFGLVMLNLAGFTLNQLSVAGFVLSLGLLVDDAIVVIENVARWLRDGASRTRAAVGATSQIALAVVGCTASLMFAFLPLMALPEASGEFIRSLPVAVLGTVLGSLIVALTVIPFAASRLLAREENPEGNRLLQMLTRGIRWAYAPVLHRALGRPGLSLALIMGVSALAIPLLSAIGSSLFPPADLPQFLVRVEMPQGTALTQTDTMVRRVEARLRTEPAVVWTAANTGRGNPQLYYNIVQEGEDPAFGEVAVGLEAWDPVTSPQLVETLRNEFKRIPGADVSVLTFNQGPQIEAPVAIRIVGPDVAVLSRLAAKGERALKSLPELRDIGNPLRIQRTDLRLDVDEARAAALDVPAGALRQSVQLALGGAQAATLRDSDGDDYPVTARLPMRDHNEISAFDRIYVPTNAGASVPLSVLAKPVPMSGPAEIARDQRERSVTLTAYVKDGHLVSDATKAAVEKLEGAVQLPPGYAFKIAGEAETQSRSFGGLLPAIIIATVGILAVLVLEFGSFRTVAVVAGVIPLGFFGAVVALWLTGNSLSFTASIGLIALVGIEIKNSILLVDFTEQLRRDGLTVREAVEKAGELRFLPVLLTSITAIGGLMPLAVEGNGLFSPMAIAMIGGLIASTLLARVATPVMYLLLTRNRHTQEDDIAPATGPTEIPA